MTIILPFAKFSCEYHPSQESATWSNPHLGLRESRAIHGFDNCGNPTQKHALGQANQKRIRNESIQLFYCRVASDHSFWKGGLNPVSIHTTSILENLFFNEYNTCVNLSLHN
jgi:hypothetical protein